MRRPPGDVHYARQLPAHHLHSKWPCAWTGHSLIFYLLIWLGKLLQPARWGRCLPILSTRRHVCGCRSSGYGLSQAWPPGQTGGRLNLDMQGDIKVLKSQSLFSFCVYVSGFVVIGCLICIVIYLKWSWEKPISHFLSQLPGVWMHFALVNCIQYPPYNSRSKSALRAE